MTTDSSLAAARLVGAGLRRAAGRRHDRGHPLAATRRPGPGARAARGRLPGHAPAAVLHAQPRGRPGLRGPPVRRVQHRVGGPGRGGPRPDRGAGDRGAAVERARGGRVPGVRPGPGPRPGQPAARAPRRAGSRARPHPVRGGGARGELRHARRVPGRRVRGVTAHAGRRGVRGAADRGLRRRHRRRGPARVAFRGPVAPALAVSRERRRGRRPPRGRRAGSCRPRRDPRGRLRRPAVRRAPGGRHRGRPAGAPDAGLGRGAGRPRRRRGARRPRHRGDGRRVRGGRRRSHRGLVGPVRGLRPGGRGTCWSWPGRTASAWSGPTRRACCRGRPACG